MNLIAKRVDGRSILLGPHIQVFGVAKGLKRFQEAGQCLALRQNVDGHVVIDTFLQGERSTIDLFGMSNKANG